jgi:hypothetical protein
MWEKKMEKSMKRKTAILGFLLVFFIAIWVVGLGCWPFLHWSPLNRWHEKVDLNTGRIRRQWELLGIYVSDTIEESAISRILATEIADKPANWRIVNTFSPLVNYSPHYSYHAAIWQIQELELDWKVVPFTEEAKKQAARDILMLWQLGKGYNPVNKYMQEIETISEKRIKNKPMENKPITVDDLPDIKTFLK